MCIRAHTLQPDRRHEARATSVGDDLGTGKRVWRPACTSLSTWRTSIAADSPAYTIKTPRAFRVCVPWLVVSHANCHPWREPIVPSGQDRRIFRGVWRDCHPGCGYEQRQDDRRPRLAIALASRDGCGDDQATSNQDLVKYPRTCRLKATR